MKTATHVLHPGDVVCVARGERIETLLGSCVAVVLTDARRSVAAVCHLVHAGVAARADLTPAHGSIALATMDAMLSARGIDARRCEAFVYGGGNMFPALVRGDVHVGASNARWTLNELAARGTLVRAKDIGGQVYRRLGWTVGPGEPEVEQVRA